MNFSSLSSMDFLLYRISVELDKAKVIRQIQERHLKEVLKQRELIVDEVKEAKF